MKAAGKARVPGCPAAVPGGAGRGASGRRAALRSWPRSARAAARSRSAPLAELGAGLLEDLGAGVECLAQFIASARAWPGRES
jgi:hypothetical protein